MGRDGKPTIRTEFNCPEPVNSKVRRFVFNRGYTLTQFAKRAMFNEIKRIIIEEKKIKELKEQEKQ